LCGFKILQAEQFIKTISQAAANLTIFIALLAVVLWAYAQTIFVSFGTDISEYKTITNALVNTFKAMIEGFDIDELRASNEYLGSILYISFLFIAFFVMLNMFLAIIAKTYDDVNSAEAQEDPMAHEFREGLKASLHMLLRWSKPRDPGAVTADLAAQLAEAKANGELDDVSKNKEGDGEGAGSGGASEGAGKGEGGGGGVGGGGFGEQGASNDAGELNDRIASGGGHHRVTQGVSFKHFKNLAEKVEYQNSGTLNTHSSTNLPRVQNSSSKGGRGGKSGVVGVKQATIEVPEVEVPEEVLLGLLSAVRELSVSVRQV
jgi:uncharacterized membrane protein YgcG